MNCFTPRLTAPQLQAIDSIDTDIMCVAGPGSGKTRTLIKRIEHVIANGTPSKGIVVLTYTNAAANEVEKRMRDNAVTKSKIDAAVFGDGYSILSLPGYCGTLHGFAFRKLVAHGHLIGYGPKIAVISPESAQDLLELKARSLGCKETIKKLLEIKAAGVKVKGRMNLAETTVASFLQDLREANLVDFDILLGEFERLVREFPAKMAEGITHLFVDEVQDSSEQDWRIYHGLPIANKFMVGDPDQAIYGFRGGRVAGMIDHAHRPDVKVIALEDNFRSMEEICQTSQRLIEHNTGRIRKTTRSACGPGGRIVMMPEAANEGEEIGIVSRSITGLIGVERIDPNEIAVISRTNAIAYAFQKTLSACGLPVRQRKPSTLPADLDHARALVEFMAEPDNDTLAFLYLCARDRKLAAPVQVKLDAQSRIREASVAGRSANQHWFLVPKGKEAVDVPSVMITSGVSREAIAWTVERIQTMTGTTMADLALAMAKPEETVQEDGQGIHCLTIHAAKGREFAAVFLVGMEEETIPGKRKDVDIEEERRLAYVAATRAKDFLAISWSRSRVTPWGAIESLHPSRFISELTGTTDKV